LYPIGHSTNFGNRFPDHRDIVVPYPIAYESVRNFQANQVFFYPDKPNRFDPGGKMLRVQVLLEMSKCLLPESIHKQYNGWHRQVIDLLVRNGGEGKYIHRVVNNCG
jgi:hypothetical protein